VIDPEGDYQSLDGLPGVVTLGGEDPAPSARDLARALRNPGISVIVDLSRMPHHLRSGYIRSVLLLLNTLRRTTGLPHKILVDEAHYSLAAGNAPLIDLELAGYILVTYRISALDETIRETSDAVVMVTEKPIPDEVETLNRLCRPQPCEMVGPKHFATSARTKWCCSPVRRSRLGVRDTF
jgi:hypothetical protein